MREGFDVTPVYIKEKAEKCRRFSHISSLRSRGEDARRGVTLCSSFCPTVLTGAMRSCRQESETDTQQGSASSIFRPRLFLTPVSSRTSRHLTPLNSFEASLSIFSLLTSHSPFLSSFSGCLPVPAFVPIPPSLSVFLMAPPFSLASGSSHTSNMPGILCTVLHTFTWHQGNSDDLHTKCFSIYCMVPLLFSLFLSLNYLFFVIVMKHSHHYPCRWQQVIKWV